MKIFFRVLLTVAMAGLIVGGALTWRWISERRSASEQEAAENSMLYALHASVVRSEVSAVGGSALVKLTVRVRNDGEPVRLGPGSFWLVAGGLPFLDRNAAEQPQAEPLTLTSGAESPEMTLRFRLPPSGLAAEMVLLVGPAPTSAVTESRPPQEATRVLVKAAGAPKGPFREGQWKTYTGTQWR